MKPKRITFNTTARIDQMLEELKNSRGLQSTAGAILYAIGEAYNREFPTYVRMKNDIGGNARREEQDAKSRVKQLNLLNQLEGKIVMVGDTEYIEYYTYSGKNRFLQKIPLIAVSEELVDAQYFPNKKAILKLQSEKNVNYEVK